MELQVQVGSPSKQSTGTKPVVLGGGSGELISAPLHGKNYTHSLSGNIYVGNQGAAGAVLPIYSNTTQQCGLLNPATSGVNLVPLQINFGYVDTTGAAGSFALGYITTGDGVIATGGKGVTVATLATPINLNLGGKASKAIFMASAITTVAPGLLMQLGVNQLVTTAATTSATTFETQYKFDDELIIPPGSGIFVAGNIAVLIKMAVSIIWKEIPLS